jgi:ABC-type lipoprotein release transport system permease subunit
MSLGANSGNVVRILMSSGLKLVAVGGAIGIVAAVLVAPLLGSILFGVQGRDIVAFTAMPFILFAVAAVAAFVPALRASRIDPVRALHTE